MCAAMAMRVCSALGDSQGALRQWEIAWTEGADQKLRSLPYIFLIVPLLQGLQQFRHRGAQTMDNGHQHPSYLTYNTVPGKNKRIPVKANRRKPVPVSCQSTSRIYTH